MDARVLDSWAVLAWLQDEPAGQAVAALLDRAAQKRIEAHWSSISAGEVYYQLVRRLGLETAESFWRQATRGELPLRLHVPTHARVRRAAQLKARLPIAYADAFALALALELRAPLVTGDPELRAAAPAVGATLEWLR